MKDISICFLGCSYKTRPSEYDYLFKDILSELKVSQIIFDPDFKYKNNSDILVYHCFDPKEIRNFYPGPSSPTYEQLIEILNWAKPDIVIQLSDEHESHNNNNHNEISNNCNLFIRQYRHLSHEYSKNTLFMPLGYNNGFTNKICDKPISQRKYNWSWSGSLKNDRMWMISIFSYLSKGNVHINSSLSKSELYSLYSDSIFVPCGKGYSSYDCFRIYEAIVCGAIPVIVGPKEELLHAFNYNDCDTPFLFYNTWEEAVNACLDKIKNPNQLQEIQTKHIHWWKKINKNIRNKITENINYVKNTN
jgi:hypothetical protein